ncbi:MAG TPA: FG-GAP-like repeat-containing protein, partial [Candidatus Deferrimicrobiaceae bacterium]
MSFSLLVMVAGCGGPGSGVANTPPVAEAGADRTATVGVPVVLDGTGSTDADGDVLAYRWTLASRPAGSSAVLSTATSAASGFTPDVPGTYVAHLLVDDGRTATASDNVIVTALFDTSPVFGASTAIPTGSLPKAVAIGDLNGDGRNDVVMTTWYGSDAANDFKLFVFLQGSDGQLLPPVKYPTRGSYAASPTSVAIGDVAGNGRNAVVVGLSRSGIEVFPCDNAGTLGASSFRATANSQNVRIADLNHDGRMDIAGVGWGTGSVDVLYQDSSGALLPPVTLPVTHGGREDLELGDVNGDGLSDIIVMSGQTFLPSIGILY